MSVSLNCIGVISIGEMGLGVARLLIAHGYRVVTFVADRSATTQNRASSAGVEECQSLREMVCESDYLLSIVPPKDAHDTARRIAAELPSRAAKRPTSLYFLELNAISPSSARSIAALFAATPSAAVTIDGGIIGGPPQLVDGDRWKSPRLVMSGPSPLPDSRLTTILNVRHVSTEIGAASGLKMCFASLTKGFTALAIQSFTTAQGLGTLPELRDLLQEHFPAMLSRADAGVRSMPPKAYRWVREMEEIGDTFADEGFERDLFYQVAQVYRTVADDPILGQEQTGQRERGQTAEDVAGILHGALSREGEDI
ncbi:6-phosphogluconate dehydrogenase C-terminal domain-like protein [Aspergillus candidus]|uniref:6-phosphogluconate dehydrogenase C-terminal domain-like protein n=1 Tax=Aspergillus candidus TaxID=41067 RepID=A0A2I2F434_ASPCN|nr:6-phosphogluconate dehydrogenase C-terminal domain-like protein [Aspergillus candidus]PLB35395.1 6-phosphogluconate dehydrogenase C-terminal domain-like protein [Aspergillus candidus]